MAKRSGRPWYRTPEQQSFLDEKTPLYLEAQAECTSKGAVVAAKVIEEWLKRWPESEALGFNRTSPNDNPLTDEERMMQSQLISEATEKRRRQLQTYLTWHANVLRSSAGRGSRRPDGNDRLLEQFLVTEKKIRKKQPAKVYAKLYAEYVNTRIEEELKDLALPGKNCLKADKAAYWKERLKRQNTLIYRLWNEEGSKDPTIHAAVMAEKERLDNPATGDDTTETTPVESSVTMDLESGIDDAMADLRQTQKAINLIGPVAIRVLEKLQEKTGWAFTLLMGGLNENGLHESYNLHIGKTAVTQLSWPEYCPDFDNTVMKQFNEFLTCVFPELTQLERVAASAKQMIVDDHVEGGREEIVDDQVEGAREKIVDDQLEGARENIVDDQVEGGREEIVEVGGINKVHVDNSLAPVVSAIPFTSTNPITPNGPDFNFDLALTPITSAVPSTSTILTPDPLPFNFNFPLPSTSTISVTPNQLPFNFNLDSSLDITNSSTFDSDPNEWSQFFLDNSTLLPFDGFNLDRSFPNAGLPTHDTQNVPSLTQPQSFVFDDWRMDESITTMDSTLNHAAVLPPTAASTSLLSGSPPTHSPTAPSVEKKAQKTKAVKKKASQKRKHKDTDTAATPSTNSKGPRKKKAIAPIPAPIAVRTSKRIHGEKYTNSSVHIR